MKKQDYLNKDAKAQQRYLEKWTSNVHHVIIVYMIYCHLVETNCEGSYPYIFLYDDVCFLQIDSVYVKTTMFYLGYITQNYIELAFWINDQDKTAKQLLMHHKMVVPGVFIGMWSGYAIPSISNIAYLCEISAIFLNYRSMFSKEEMNKPIPTVNQVTFFFAFTIFRFLMFPWLFYQMVLTSCWTWHAITWDRKLAMVVSSSMYCWMMCLNFYWYSLILKGLKRLLQEQGVLSKPDNMNATDEIYNIGVESGGTQEKLLDDDYKKE